MRARLVDEGGNAVAEGGETLVDGGEFLDVEFALLVGEVAGDLVLLGACEVDDLELFALRRVSAYRGLHDGGLVVVHDHLLEGELEDGVASRALGVGVTATSGPVLKGMKEHWELP